GAREVPYGRAPPFLRALRRAVRPTCPPQLRRARARAPARGLPDALARPGPSTAAAGEARRASAHLAGGPRRRGRRRPRRRRAEAPVARPPAPPLRPPLERSGRGAARRGSDDPDRSAAHVRPRDRRRGAGPLTYAAARDLPARDRRLAHD